MRRRPANERASSPVRARPLVGLIRNARSHRNESADAPTTERDDVIVARPDRRSELIDILADFAARQVDGIAIDGGDGTIRDVLTCGAGIFGEDWPPLIVLPAGKTNALAIDLAIPTDWTLDAALAAMADGRMTERRPLVIAQRDDARAQVRGFIFGAGLFNRCIALGQKSHDLGAFNAAVVGFTAAWSVLQAFFGSSDNGWRSGTAMRVSEADGREVPHFGGLPEGERFLLFASSLEHLPAGLDPMRGLAGKVRMIVLDNPRRSLLLRIGAVMRGRASEATLRRGVHRLGGDSFDIDLGDTFVLDGEAFPPGTYRLSAGAPLRFVTP
ncbi:diacylglycerol/lipid kinase family protein [Aurantiacibacter luteus]|uniref:diacylglycerol/lipid kinase family protein n=1 Tax=Aurantiacibacter luteus TaxID=1581420 RepID=UPI00138E2DFB|nr:diacylglycerol kinase family protein [Aurantiacibacter luteus]